MNTAASASANDDNDHDNEVLFSIIITINTNTHTHIVHIWSNLSINVRNQRGYYTAQTSKHAAFRRRFSAKR